MGQLLLALLTATSPAGAQQKVDHIPATPQTENPWQWSWDANVFVGWNYQYRKFTDFKRTSRRTGSWGLARGELARGGCGFR